MKYLHWFIFGLVVVALSACGKSGGEVIDDDGKVIPPPSSSVTVTVGIPQQEKLVAQSNGLITQGIPETEDGQQIALSATVSVFQDGVEIFFDAEGNLTTTGDGEPIQLGTAAGLSTEKNLQLTQGATYTFKLVGYEEGKEDKGEELVYGERTVTISQDNSNLFIPLFTIIDKEGITFERQDGGTQGVIEANTFVDYYLVVNASKRTDLFASVADFTAQNYINTLGTIVNVKGSSNRGARLEVNLLPECKDTINELSVQLEGYVVDDEGVISKEVVLSPTFELEIVDNEGLRICQDATAEIDSVKPVITTELTSDSDFGHIKVTGTVADLHSGVDRVQVYDGVILLGEVTLPIAEEDTSRNGPYTFSWELPNNTVNRELVFIAYDRGQNVQRSEVASVYTQKVCEKDFTLTFGGWKSGTPDELQDCTHIKGDLGLLYFENEPYELPNNLNKLESVTGRVFLGLIPDSLLSFDSLVLIGGGLEIAGVSRSSEMINLDGFNSLQSIGTHLIIQELRPTERIDGFNSLESVGGLLKISNNGFSLESINGFNNLREVGTLQISNNDKLKEIDFLAHLSHTDGFKGIVYNSSFDCTIYNNDPSAFFPLNNSEGNKVDCTTN